MYLDFRVNPSWWTAAACLDEAIKGRPTKAQTAKKEKLFDQVSL